MDGLALAAGSGTIVEFKGEKLILDAFQIKDYGFIENHLIDLKKKINPLEKVASVVPMLPPELAEKLIARAYADAVKEPQVSAHEVSEYCQTLDGIVFQYWFPLHKRYGERIKMDDVKAWFMELSDERLEEIRKQLENANGESVLGNSTGQAPEETESQDHPVGLADEKSKPSDSGDTSSDS